MSFLPLGFLLLLVHVAADCAPSCIDCMNDTVCLQCQTGYWNEHCLHTCPRNCKDAGACDRDTGRCYACNDGYYGSECEENCPLTCKRGPVVVDHRTGGPCIAIEYIQTNETNIDSDSNTTSTTGTTVQMSSTTVLRTPLPTVERLPPHRVKIICKLGCQTGMYPPDEGCKHNCPSGCALSAVERRRPGDCVQTMAGVACPFGCQRNYGGSSCALHCPWCVEPDDPLVAPCNDTGDCTKGCPPSKFGHRCSASCNLHCEDRGMPSRNWCLLEMRGGLLRVPVHLHVWLHDNVHKVCFKTKFAEWSRLWSLYCWPLGLAVRVAVRIDVPWRGVRQGDGRVSRRMRPAILW
jgi:hypothetical protein